MKYIVTDHIYEKGVHYSPGDVVELAPERARQLGFEPFVASPEVPRMDKMVRKPRRKKDGPQ